MDQKSNGAGMEYYENLCMRVVNQSIGKNFEKTLKVLNLFDIQFAVDGSHRNDYARQ